MLTLSHLPTASLLLQDRRRRSNACLRCSECKTDNWRDSAQEAGGSYCDTSAGHLLTYSSIKHTRTMKICVPTNERCTPACSICAIGRNTVRRTLRCLVLNSWRMQEKAGVAVNSGRAPRFIQHAKGDDPNVCELNNKLVDRTNASELIPRLRKRRNNDGPECALGGDRGCFAPYVADIVMIHRRMA